MASSRNECFVWLVPPGGTIAARIKAESVAAALTSFRHSLAIREIDWRKPVTPSDHAPGAIVPRYRGLYGCSSAG